MWTWLRESQLSSVPDCCKLIYDVPLQLRSHFIIRVALNQLDSSVIVHLLFMLRFTITSPKPQHLEEMATPCNILLSHSCGLMRIWELLVSEFRLVLLFNWSFIVDNKFTFSSAPARIDLLSQSRVTNNSTPAWSYHILALLSYCGFGPAQLRTDIRNSVETISCDFT